MASIHVRFGEITPGGNPVYQRKPRATEVIGSSGATATGTVRAQASEYVTISVPGDAAAGVYAWIYADDEPAAATSAGDAVPPGSKETFGPLKAGDRVSVIDM